MKKISRYLVLLVLVLVVGFVIIYGTKKPAQEVPIKIGVISSLTGMTVDGVNYGEGFANGVSLAYEEYLVKNPNKPVKIYIEDDGYESKKGLSAYQKLVSIDKVDALINLSSPTIDVSKDLVHKEGIPVLQLGVESDVTKDNVFQSYPDQSSIKLMAEAANKDTVGEVTVVMEQIKAYEKFLSDFQGNFKGVVKVVRVPSTEKDYRSTALKIKENNSPAVLMFVGSEPGSKILNNLNTLGYKPKQLYFDLSLQIELNNYKKVLGDKSNDTLNNSKGLFYKEQVDNNFVAKYKARFNQEPGMLSSYGYDSFNILIETYNKEKQNWVNNIQNYNSIGVTGKIYYDSIGIRPAEFFVATYKDGELVVK